MLTTIALLALVSVDVAYELVAHFVFRNGKLQTLSFVVRGWEGRKKTRLVAVSLVLVVLWLHLVPKWF